MSNLSQSLTPEEIDKEIKFLKGLMFLIKKEFTASETTEEQEEIIKLLIPDGKSREDFEAALSSDFIVDMTYGIVDRIRALEQNKHGRS